MTPAELLADLRQRGAVFELDGADLRIRHPKGVLAADLRSELTRHKAELLTLLTSELRPGLDASDLPPDRWSMIDDPTLLTPLDRLVIGQLAELRRSGTHPPWAADRRTEAVS